MDQDDEKISLLLGMGFPDVQNIKRALVLSNGDMNDAVTYLTENPLPSYNTLHDLRDTEMPDASVKGSGPPSYSQHIGMKTSNSLEFPTTHLYDLENRIFVESWVIPYKKEESLGRCLIAATKLAEEGLCEADESCQRFLERCLPECFQKLLNSLAVRRWGSDIQEGVFNMVDLLIDVIIARLKTECIPEEILRNSLSLVFDCESEWNQKNRNRNSEYAGDITYAECPSKFESYGWLVDIINIFGNKGGFDLLSKKLGEKNDIDAGQITALLMPVSYSAKFMSKDIISTLFYSSIEKSINFIINLEEKDLKGKRIKYCYQLLESIRTICEIFWPDEVQRIISLHLEMIIKMLKTPHFSAKMIALKELGVIISNSEKQNNCGMESDFIQDWMTEKAVLSLALEGNLDQVQYTDRMKQLVEFLGPKLKEEELSKIWNICEKASPHVVDNIHRIMIAAATRFNPHQFDHLLKLIRKNWEFGNDRLREKLLSLIGKIGQDSRLGRTAEKMLDVLWELARVPSLPPHLVHLAVDEHLRILNESATREQLRKFFIIRCVEDIRRSPAVYLPLKQLHHLSKSITRSSSSYSKSEKATLSDLNRNLEIVKLISQSLIKSHELAVQTCKNDVPSVDTLIDGKYTHADYIFAHLDFLQFLLKEGDIYLEWPRCKEIWDTLVANSKSSLRDKETCFSWFSQCLQDLEPATQKQLFDECLLQLDCSSMSISAFNCFVDYFHAINLNERKILKNGNKIVVDCFNPLGLDFIWKIVLECSDQQLANEAIVLLLNMSYLSLSSKLKRDPPQIHQKFISECYKKLEKSLLHMDQSAVGSVLSNAAKTLTVMAVSEVVALSPASKRSCLQHIFRVLVLVERYISTIEEQFLAPRILLPHAACFLGKPVNIYVTFDSNTSEIHLQCHSNEQMKSVFNKIARAGSISTDQIQQVFFEPADQPDPLEEKNKIIFNGVEHESQLLHQLSLSASIKANVKISSGCAQLKEVGCSNWNELPDTACYMDNQEESVATFSSPSKSASGIDSQTICNSLSTSSLVSSAPTSAENAALSSGESILKEEKKLPGVVMASLGKNVFEMLYQLALLDDHRILEAVQRILYLIPTDPSIADKLDSICSEPVSRANNLANLQTSALNSPPKKEKNNDKSQRKENNLSILKSLLEISFPNISPFRLLYNLEVLSSKLISIDAEGTMQNSGPFCEEFLSCSGLSLLISLLHRESLPQDMNYEIRQNIYLIVLQLLRIFEAVQRILYLVPSYPLIADKLDSIYSEPVSRANNLANLQTSPLNSPPKKMYFLCAKEGNSTASDEDIPVSSLHFPYPPKRSALDAHSLKKQNLDEISSPVGIASSSIAVKALQSFSCDEWLEMVNSIMRAAWASAAGKLHLCSSGMNSLDNNPSSPESFKSSRENSTGSAHSSGSENERSSQGGICMQQSSLHPTDALIATQALPLLITTLSLRPSLIEKWYNMGGVKEFIIELLIGCNSSEVREKMCLQFIRLAKLKILNAVQPSQFLTQVLHKARLPLWVSSTTARGTTLKLVSHCSQYFRLLSFLLSNLSQTSQETLGVNAAQMIKDEITWMLNFTSTREATRERPESGISSLRKAENILVAGHLKLIRALLSCENVDQVKCGEDLIPILLNDYLFPASKLILGPISNSYEMFNKCSAKCTGAESRLEAYRLLARVSVTSEKNLKSLTDIVIAFHHQLDQDSIKEFERSPVVAGRCTSGYVGLKNGGATCYMNSVLQQLFMVPGIKEDILQVNSDEESEESLFYQLQSLFGHLQESQLQYYTPDKFWKCFRMGGLPVNIREQQDAFEFYSRLTEQIDDYLKTRNMESVFSRRFEGVYSIQRICQDCPHRYEREEPFLALNLTVTKCNDLHDSLDHFVKGELLEGDNAYYCEKCNKKRTAIIRACIKNLPPVLVIQLKRFGYDWEASRALKFDDYFKFPWTLDMGEYTVEALTDKDEFVSPGKDKEIKDKPSMDPPKTTKTPKTCKSPTISNSSGNSLKNAPIKSSLLSPSKFGTSRKPSRKRYELVGIIVHSGQANAGHYYSYIKDRRGDTITNPNKSKWFKFNDTTVEHVDMTNTLLEQECFGGSYKAKVSYDSSNPMPEDRLRYWNGYMLFYDSTDYNSSTGTPKTPKTPRVGRTSRSLRASSSSARKYLTHGSSSEEQKPLRSRNLERVPSSSEKSSSTSPSYIQSAQTSLCELSELLEQGERKGMFRQHIPPKILATITHDNLTFLRDRDLYSEDYFKFIYDVCYSALESSSKFEPSVSSELLINSVSLGIKFLLNTYLRSREKDVSIINKWLDLFSKIFKLEKKASEWCLNYFISSEGIFHLQPLLLECQDKMVRSHFGKLLHSVISAECKHNAGVQCVEKLIQNLLTLLSSEVSTFIKTSEQFFTLLHNYCLQGSQECHQLLNLGGFTALIQFLLGSAELNKRRWSPIQAQDFGPLHSIIAAIILTCSNTTDATSATTKQEAMEDKGSESPINNKQLEVPPSIACIVNGHQRDAWLREVVLAYREVVGGIPQLTEALKALCSNNSAFSFALITAIMGQYGSAPSNLLKDLSILLLEILSINDTLHNERIGAVLGGCDGTQGVEIQGLLSLIDSNKDSDSRRAYQCIKLIVYLSVRSTSAREHLTSTQTNWQWAVEWLKAKMDAHPLAGGAIGPGIDDLASGSNEDSNTKSFQRTTSAQWTLDEATALLSGMESMDMEIDPEQELEEIKESPENDSSPSNEFYVS